MQAHRMKAAHDTCHAKQSKRATRVPVVASPTKQTADKKAPKEGKEKARRSGSASSSRGGTSAAQPGGGAVRCSSARGTQQQCATYSGSPPPPPSSFTNGAANANANETRGKEGKGKAAKAKEARERMPKEKAAGSRPSNACSNARRDYLEYFYHRDNVLSLSDEERDEEQSRGRSEKARRASRQPRLTASGGCHSIHPSISFAKQGPRLAATRGPHSVHPSISLATRQPAPPPPWPSPPSSSSIVVDDPFAGGSVRDVVAAKLGLVGPMRAPLAPGPKNGPKANAAREKEANEIACEIDKAAKAKEAREREASLALAAMVNPNAAKALTLTRTLSHRF